MTPQSNSSEIPILAEHVATDSRDGCEERPYTLAVDGYQKLPSVVALAAFEGGAPPADEVISALAELLLDGLTVDASTEDE